MTEEERERENRDAERLRKAHEMVTTTPEIVLKATSDKARRRPVYQDCLRAIQAWLANPDTIDNWYCVYITRNAVSRLVEQIEHDESVRNDDALTALGKTAWIISVCQNVLAEEGMERSMRLALSYARHAKEE